MLEARYNYSNFKFLKITDNSIVFWPIMQLKMDSSLRKSKLNLFGSQLNVLLPIVVGGFMLRKLQMALLS